jgi:RNA polymerase sigma-70 factor (ECF subfamily)
MDEQYFKEKILPLSPLMYSICLKILRDESEAKDCIQDVFYQLWATREKLQSIRSIEAFVRTITRNKSLDRIRLQKKKLTIEQSGVSNIAQVEVSGADNTEEKMIKVREAIATLSDIQQKVFIMRDFDQMSFNEIAAELGILPDNVRVYLSRARKSIREHILTTKQGNS